MNVLMVQWTPPQGGAPELMFKAYDARGEFLRDYCAIHRFPDGRFLYQVPDTTQNRHLAETRGPGWSIVPEKEAVSAEDDKKTQVMALLTELGIPHRSNMKLETLVHKLPVGARGPFL